MSTGLETSTVTPGNTAPDASFTTPVMEAWANAMAGMSTSSASAVNPTCNLRMQLSPFVTHGRTRTTSFVLPRSRPLDDPAQLGVNNLLAYEPASCIADSSKWMILQIEQLAEAWQPPARAGSGAVLQVNVKRLWGGVNPPSVL